LRFWQKKKQKVGLDIFLEIKIIYFI